MKHIGKEQNSKRKNNRWMAGITGALLLAAGMQLYTPTLYAQDYESEWFSEGDEKNWKSEVECAKETDIQEENTEVSPVETAFTDLEEDGELWTEKALDREEPIAEPIAEGGEDAPPQEETESETEQESEEQPIRYKVYFEEDEQFLITPERTVPEYFPGEKVCFTVELEEEAVLTAVEALACEEPECPQEEGAEEPEGIEEQKEPETVLALEDLQQEINYDKQEEAFWFYMPESEVIVLVDTQEKSASSAETEETDEDAVPDKFKLVCSEYPDFPKAPSSMQSSSLNLAMTSRKKVVFYEKDGTKTTRTAYCLQPAANSPGSGDVYEQDQAVELEDKTAKDKNLTKALYYLYGGPAWGNTVEYADGSGSVNLKDLLNNGGKDCTTKDQYYCMTHYVLSYLYLGESGKWNYMYTTEPVSGVLNDHGVSTVKKIAKELAKLPLPATQLSTDAVTAVYHSEQNASVSQTIQYKTIAENIGTIHLPKGVILVNETTGEHCAETAQLSGGDKFHLEADISVNGGKEYLVETVYAADFTAMKLVRGGNHQDVGFSYYSGDKTLTFGVEWPDSGLLKLHKTDALTGSALPYSRHYAFDHAVYGVYLDAQCDQKTAELITDAAGKASVPLPIGTYYVKEISAPAGYLSDKKIYPVKLERTAQEILVEVSDQPILKKIQIRKRDSETDEACPQNSQASFAGAEYTIYSDERCSSAVEVLTMDENGTACSGELRLADYYVKETKAPRGYLSDQRVYKIGMQQSDQQEVYEVQSPEKVIRGSLALVKYLDDAMEESVLQKRYEEGTLANIRFWLTHEDETVEPISIVTDRYGYAATERNALSYGTWYLSEDPQTTPKGYQGLQRVKIEITQDGEEQVYVVTNKPYAAYLCIRKVDRESGAKITLSSAKFQILDKDGQTVKMPTFDGYTDTFVTNEQGEIHLTKSLKGGSYTLVETEAPEGYQKAEPIPFVIQENRVFDEPLILECEDVPQRGGISITKIDKETGEHCGPGFVFQIIAGEDIVDGSGQVRSESIDGTDTLLKAGTVVDTIVTDEEGLAVSRKLYLGRYLVREKTPGAYYANNGQEYEVVLTQNEEGQPIIAELRIENEKTKLVVVKQDSLQNIRLEGVRFRLWPSESGREKTEEGEMMERVTDQNGIISFENLKKDTLYLLREIETLPGYVLDDATYEIQVDSNGWIQRQAVYEMTLGNTPNTVEISKQSMTGGEELPGAKLTLSDSAGNLIESWTSGKEPHRIMGLKAGRYMLTEVTAPKGYELAESISFLVEDSLEIQKVTMYDRSLEKKTESETPETEKKTPTDTAPKTGDTTPMKGLLFLAVCSFLAGMGKLFSIKNMGKG